MEGVELLLGKGRKDESGDFTEGAGLDEVRPRASVLELPKLRPPRRRHPRGSDGAPCRAVAGDTIAKAGVEALEEINAILTALGIPGRARRI